ncbi:hypothetical protein [Chitinophaga filiformis]|uniref:Uncharacterized protein n=1 Tax=Chitinophaga filiformis TaxID=104663 RepID=A0A1G7MDM9_CHIFI|nr:hypothetical protein [Chitinophaga filiformis]SDF59843.1 hypothetical protein SAMN04488121_102384 [Chitinophaga filiformis]
MEYLQEITLLQWVGLVLLFFARRIKRTIRRRRFERTNAFGVQGFTSFNAYEYTSFSEGIIYILASVLQLGGILLLLLEWVANGL